MRPACNRAIFRRTEFEPISTAANVGMEKAHSLHAAGKIVTGVWDGTETLDSAARESTRQNPVVPGVRSPSLPTCPGAPKTQPVPPSAYVGSRAKPRARRPHAGTCLRLRFELRPPARID